jgi:hypothetical protein
MGVSSDIEGATLSSALRAAKERFGAPNLLQGNTNSPIIAAIPVARVDLARAPA